MRCRRNCWQCLKTAVGTCPQSRSEPADKGTRQVPPHCSHPLQKGSQSIGRSEWEALPPPRRQNQRLTGMGRTSPCVLPWKRHGAPAGRRAPSSPLGGRERAQLSERSGLQAGRLPGLPRAQHHSRSPSVAEGVDESRWGQGDASCRALQGLRGFVDWTDQGAKPMRLGPWRLHQAEGRGCESGKSGRTAGSRSL